MKVEMTITVEIDGNERLVLTKERATALLKQLREMLEPPPLVVPAPAPYLPPIPGIW